MTRSLTTEGWDGVSGLVEIRGSSTTAHAACRPMPMVRPVRLHVMDDDDDDDDDDVDDCDDDEDDVDEDDDDDDDDDDDQPDGEDEDDHTS